MSGFPHQDLHALEDATKERYLEPLTVLSGKPLMRDVVALPGLPLTCVQVVGPCFCLSLFRAWRNASPVRMRSELLSRNSSWPSCDQPHLHQPYVNTSCRNQPSHRVWFTFLGCQWAILQLWKNPACSLLVIVGVWPPLRQALPSDLTCLTSWQKDVACNRSDTIEEVFGKQTWAGVWM